MKEYIKPEMDVILYNVSDVITATGEGTGTDNNETGMDPIIVDP